MLFTLYSFINCHIFCRTLNAIQILIKGYTICCISNTIDKSELGISNVKISKQMVNNLKVDIGATPNFLPTKAYSSGTAINRSNSKAKVYVSEWAAKSSVRTNPNIATIINAGRNRAKYELCFFSIIIILVFTLDLE